MTKKGNKPDFHKSAGGQQAKELYDYFVEKIRGDYQRERVRDGVFAAMMDVALVNDGPVTIELNADAPIAPVPSTKSAGEPSNSELASEI